MNQVERDAIAQQVIQRSTEISLELTRKASALETHLWNFIDLAATMPHVKPDPRVWEHVVVYADKTKVFEALKLDMKAIVEKTMAGTVGAATLQQALEIEIGKALKGEK